MPSCCCIAIAIACVPVVVVALLLCMYVSSVYDACCMLLAHGKGGASLCTRAHWQVADR
jgi:hypothetical protein